MVFFEIAAFNQCIPWVVIRYCIPVSLASFSIYRIFTSSLKRELIDFGFRLVALCNSDRLMAEVCDRPVP